jgi:hypothetical protein
MTAVCPVLLSKRAPVLATAHTSSVAPDGNVSGALVKSRSGRSCITTETILPRRQQEKELWKFARACVAADRSNHELASVGPN